MTDSVLLNGFSDLRFFVSRTQDGDMSLRSALEVGDKAMIERIIQNRNRFLTKVGIEPGNCVSARLNGRTDRVALVSARNRGQAMTWYDDDSVRDGLITDQPDVGLFMVSADCPIAIYFDPAAKVLGMAHFSWITTDKRLPEKMVSAMTKLTSASVENIRVFIGPGIKKESYVFVDPEQKRSQSWQKHIENLESGETAIDLNSYQREQLLGVGVKPANIEFSFVDTAKEQSYYSHYRSVRTGEPEGRFATVAVMTN
jgi:polyphenol oxidase